jgi:vacuolar-type H+-ATPase subunit E/Vma4
MNPFELALGVEAKQLMDLAIPKIRSIHCEGDKEAKEMAKECEKRKAQVTKLLEKTQASYEKQANKSQRHIEFEVGDLM